MCIEDRSVVTKQGGLEEGSIGALGLADENYYTQNG